jgi:hypothetical protein
MLSSGSWTVAAGSHLRDEGCGLKAAPALQQHRQLTPQYDAHDVLLAVQAALDDGEAVVLRVLELVNDPADPLDAREGHGRAPCRFRCGDVGREAVWVCVKERKPLQLHK